ncbi:hypothetical protein D210916BOD24_15260 [Alteromonas sp. D210916BOD_24]|uniref:carbohydrate porin n=1 Tax=Alteromonas sp. D210916BOD_24 TaxID=3157618 RepID=UPI00399D4ED6
MIQSKSIKYALFITSLVLQTSQKLEANESVNPASENVTISGDFTFDYGNISTLDEENINLWLLKLYAKYDLSKLIGTKSAFYSSFAMHRGDRARPEGNLQGFNNIDADEIAKVYEAFFQFEFSEKHSIKIGRQDANVDFAAPNFAGEFLNPSMGFSPTILLPSYGTPVLAVSYHHSISDSANIKLGLFESTLSNKTFDEQFIIAQYEHIFSSGIYIKLGGWYDTSIDYGNGYAIAEYQYNNDVSITLQYGEANREKVGLTNHLGISLNRYNLFYPNDVIGIGYTTVNAKASNEHIVEFFYGYQLSEHIKLKADVQNINSKGVFNSTSNVVTTTLRFQFNF